MNIATRKLNRGFTLIELLVVIAIIAILAAILFPVFSRAREKALQTKCLSNVKQIGLAFQMYMTDNNGTMPPWYDLVNGNLSVVPWRDQALPPYLRNSKILICPSHPEGEAFTGGIWAQYGVNRNICPPDSAGKIDVFSNVDQLIMLTDSWAMPWVTWDRGCTWNAGVYAPYYHPQPCGLHMGRYDPSVGLYNGIANVVYCDGHAEAKKALILSCPTAAFDEAMSLMWVGDRYTG